MPFNTKIFQLIPVIKGYTKKKQKAQGILLEHFYGQAKRICLCYAANHNEAEEMVDVGFLKIFDKIAEEKAGRNSGFL